MFEFNMYFIELKESWCYRAHAVVGELSESGSKIFAILQPCFAMRSRAEAARGFRQESCHFEIRFGVQAAC